MVKQLSVNTATVDEEHQLHSPGKDKFNTYDETPRTEASTPGSSYAPIRGQSDIRSPGIAKTPQQPSLDSPVANPNTNGEGGAAIAIATAPIPDFITQTDKYGNASTPRSQTAMQQTASNHDNKLVEKSDTDETTDIHEKGMAQPDACDTLLESFRMMCCCLLADTHDIKHRSSSNNNNNGSHVNNEAAEHKMQITKKRIGGGGGSTYGHMDDKARFHERAQIKLLPNIVPEDHGKKCLVLDLDETLVHSSFRAVEGADFVIPVQIEDVIHYVYVMKRPGVDEFLVEMAKHYEIILYTASLNKYADPLLDLLDPHRTIRTRLFRESCVYYEGNYVKDLSLLDRDLSTTIIVDNSPASYIFHPENAIDCSSFIDDPADCELHQLASFLKGVKNAKDVRPVCHLWREWPHIPRIEETAMDVDTFVVDSREDKHVQ